MQDLKTVTKTCRQYLALGLPSKAEQTELVEIRVRAENLPNPSISLEMVSTPKSECIAFFLVIC
jgi:hypothetical protein